MSGFLLLALDERNRFIAIYQGPQHTVVTKASFQDGRCQIQRMVGARMESSIISSASAIYNNMKVLKCVVPEQNPYFLPSGNSN